MPRYFFNVYHERSQLDQEGEELPDRHAAWKEATVTAGRMMQDIDGKLQPGREWRLEVTDKLPTRYTSSTSTSRPPSDPAFPGSHSGLSVSPVHRFIHC